MWKVKNKGEDQNTKKGWFQCFLIIIATRLHFQWFALLVQYWINGQSCFTKKKKKKPISVGCHWNDHKHDVGSQDCRSLQLFPKIYYSMLPYPEVTKTLPLKKHRQDICWKQPHPVIDKDSYIHPYPHFIIFCLIWQHYCGKLLQQPHKFQNSLQKLHTSATFFKSLVSKT